MGRCQVGHAARCVMITECWFHRVVTFIFLKEMKDGSHDIFQCYCSILCNKQMADTRCRNLFSYSLMESRFVSIFSVLSFMVNWYFLAGEGTLLYYHFDCLGFFFLLRYCTLWLGLISYSFPAHIYYAIIDYKPTGTYLQGRQRRREGNKRLKRLTRK